MLDEFRSTSITWDKATRRIYSPITANASDSNGRKLNIQVVNSGQVENLTGATLHLYWETKDKVHDGLDAFTASDISKGEFEIFYTTGMLSNVGELNATLVLVDSTGKVVSDWFKITVTRGINEGAIESENSFSSLTQALIDVSNLEQNYAPRLNDLTAQLQQTEQSLNAQLAEKVDKGNVSVNDINKNLGKFDQTYMTDTFIQQMAGNAPINAVPADYSLIEKQFAVPVVLGLKSKNLFDKSVVVPNKYVAAEDGLEKPLSGYHVSDWIKVAPNTTYTIHYPFIIVAYNDDKTFLSSVPPSNGTITTPVDCEYIRFNTTTANLDIQQMELGDIKTPFEEYGTKNDIKKIPSIPNEKLSGGITADKLSFPIIQGIESKNLFDKTKVTVGKYPFAETGTLGTNADFSTSDWIAVAPNTTYTISHPYIIVAYDTNKVYISSLTAPTFTTPPNCYYIRFGMYNNNLDVQQMELGTEKTSYATFGAKLARTDVIDIDNPYEYDLLIPSTVYLVGGERISVYYDSLIKYYQDFTKRSCYIVAQQKLSNGYAVKGQQYNYKWEYTPTNTDGTFDVEFRVVSTYDGSILASKVVTFIVADSSLALNHGRTANIVSVGDSFMDNDTESIIGKLYDNITTKGGINAVNMLGLHRASWVNSSVKDDSWAGYTYSWLYNSPIGYLREDRPLSHATWDVGWGENEEFGWTTGQTYADLTDTQRSHGKTKNQFYNPATQKFDFSYYMSTYMDNQAVDGFICNYGLNDVGWVTVNEAKATIAALVPKITHIINSVHAYDTTIKVLLYLIPKQKADNNTMGRFYTNFAHYERVNHNIELFNEMLLKNFGNKTNVHILPSNVNFDSEKGYKTKEYNPDKFDEFVAETWSNDIHPNEKGALYIADTLYQAVYSLVLK